MKTTIRRFALYGGLCIPIAAAAAAPGFTPPMPNTEGFQFRPVEQQRSQGVRPSDPRTGFGTSGPRSGRPASGFGFSRNGPRRGPRAGSSPWPGAAGSPANAMGRQARGAGRYAPYGAGGASAEPRVEATLSTDEAYAQENLIYTVRVLSTGNLSLADPVLPENSNVVFHKIDGPVTSSRTENGRREIVNEFHYALTPLRAGSLSLEPARVTGELARGSTYDERAAQPLSLEVRPPRQGVQPWLPLQDLQVQTQLRNADEPEAGKPLTLVIEMKAVGATGAQLPSLEKQLQSQDFRIYQEKVESHGMLSPDGKHLEGRRVESYTLVPQHGGRIRIPSLHLRWWNVKADRPETLVLPIRQLVAGGGRRGDGPFGLTQASTLFPAGSPLMFWLPLLGIAFLLGTYWSWIWARNKGLIRKGLARASAAVGMPGSKLRGLIERHPPRRYMHLARQGVIQTMPRSLRLWYCVRYADSETDPAEWCQMLKFLSHKHLGISPQLPAPELAKRLVAAQPRADAPAIRGLLSELDGRVYGSERLDFQAWKRSFRRALRPRLIPEGRRPRFLRRRAHRLPDLNPRSA